MNNDISKLELYDLIILGAGPAGVAASVYAARKRLKTALITYDFLGQSSVSSDIQNWIGVNHISGIELSKNLENHAREYEGEFLHIYDKNKIIEILKNDNDIDNENKYTIKTDKNIYKTKTILIATGSKRRRLDVKGADIFEHKGLTYCATCDGPLYANTDTVVIGGGNAAFETALQLASYAKSVTILNRTENFKADEITIQKVKNNNKIKIYTNTIINEIIGDKFVNSINISKNNIEEILNVEGIFVEIGQIPNSDFVNFVEKNSFGQIIVNSKTQRTSENMIWAAGDITDGLYHQNNIAVGDAVKAIENIFINLQK